MVDSTPEPGNYIIQRTVNVTTETKRKRQYGPAAFTATLKHLGIMSQDVELGAFVANLINAEGYSMADVVRHFNSQIALEDSGLCITEPTLYNHMYKLGYSSRRIMVRFDQNVIHINPK